MPNRILKESICVSDSISELTWFEEVLFYRLIVSCDDYGRYDGRIPVIKNKLFPLKENITNRNISDGINKLVSTGLVSLYEVDGKPFLYLPTWNYHQIIRAKRSKYPDPSDGNNLQASEIKCNQMKSDASKCPRNPIQSESNPNPNPYTRFADFWDSYPKKTAKPDAERAWKKLKPSEELSDRIIHDVEIRKGSSEWTKNGGQFIPYPATYLNQRRWEDEVSIKRHGYEEHKPASLDHLLVNLDEE